MSHNENISELLRIGEIAKMCDISTQTLRYYDKIGILKPINIDSETGYRYYSQEQLFELVSIKCLKDIGFSLSGITEYLKHNDRTKIQKLYLEKQRQIDEEIKKLYEVKKKLEIRIKLFDSFFPESSQIILDDNINIKKIAKRKVVFVRENINFNIKNRLKLANMLQCLISSYNIQVKPPITHVFHESYYNLFNQNFDIEVCNFIDNDYNKQYDFIREINEGLYACSVHNGGHEASFETYKKIEEWINNNGYIINGLPLLLYTATLTEVKSPDKVVFEIQIPIIEKK